MFAEAHDYRIVKEYEDAAMSGTTSDHPQYQLTLSEVGTIRPVVLILWKTDRPERDRFELADAKRRIRDAGCRVCLIAEPTPDDSPESVLMETMMEGMAEFYSRQLSQNIRRGMTYNAERALYNGHKVWGYGVDEELFDSAQRRLAENKRNGSRRRASATAEHAPRYWLTGKLFCGECGGSMQGVSGTSKTGAKPLLLLLQGAEGREVLEEARSQGVGRERGHGHPQGIPGRQREPRVNRCGRGQIL